MTDPTPSARAALATLLGQLFDSDGLRRFLHGALPMDVSGPLLAGLPGEIASEAEVIDAAINALIRMGCLDAALFAALGAAAPGRKDAIGAVEEQWFPGAQAATAPGPSAPPPLPKNNLPRSRNHFFGRSSEMTALRARLEAGQALITVVGVAGAGKTRLAVEMCRTQVDAWPGGVWCSDLSAAIAADEIAVAVARDLGIVLGSEAPVATVGGGLAARGKALFLLDHFEQAVASAAQTLGPWIDQAPEAVFLVTSRAVLNLSGETIFPLDPLPPGDDAVALFVDRAQARRPDFSLTPQLRADIEALIAALDGLPLALELAAARIRTLTPAQMLARIQDRFQLLVGGPDPSGQPTSLRAAFDASWDLLELWEKAAFAQASVFAGGFLLPAAEFVFDLSACPSAPPPMDIVQSLVDKSLFRSWVPPDLSGVDPDADEPTFGMFVSIQAYAAEKLAAADPGRAAEARHGQWYARFGEQAALDALEGPEAVPRRARLTRELENLEQAALRAITRRDAEVAARSAMASWGVLEIQGPFAQGEGLLDAARGVCTDPATGAALDCTWGTALVALQRMSDALPKFEAALAWARTAADPRMQGIALGQEGAGLRGLGRGAEAEAAYRQALDLLHGVGAAGPAATVLGRLANVLREQDRIPDAEATYREAATQHHAVGNQRGEANVTGNLGALYSDTGSLEQALGYFDQALALHRAIGARRDQGVVLANRAAALVQLGRYDEARISLDEALALHRATGARGYEGVALGILGTLLAQQGLPDQARAAYESAIDLHRKTGNRRNEAIALLNLGALEVGQGASADARATLRQADDVAVALGSTRLEGAALSGLGELDVLGGLLPDAETALARAVTLLRSAGDQLELGKALARQTRLLAARGDSVGAGAALAEAEATLAPLALPAGTDGAQQLTLAQQAVAALAPPLPPPPP